MSRKNVLFSDSDDDGGSEGQGKDTMDINQEFQSRYLHNQKRIERERLEQKYGAKGVGEEGDGDGEEYSSSSSQSDDSDAKLLNQKNKEKYNDLLRKIINRDSNLQTHEGEYFNESDFEASSLENEQGTGRKNKDKKVTYKDVQRMDIEKKMTKRD